MRINDTSRHTHSYSKLNITFFEFENWGLRDPCLAYVAHTFCRTAKAILVAYDYTTGTLEKTSGLSSTRRINDTTHTHNFPYTHAYTSLLTRVYDFKQCPDLHPDCRSVVESMKWTNSARIVTKDYNSPNNTLSINARVHTHPILHVGVSFAKGPEVYWVDSITVDYCDAGHSECVATNWGRRLSAYLTDPIEWIDGTSEKAIA